MWPLESSMQCHACPARLYNIFQHYLINSTIFEGKKKVPERKMCVLVFSTIFLTNISHSKNRARYDHKCISVFMQSTLYSCPILMKLEFSRQIFEGYSNTKYCENSSSGSRVVPCGRAGGRT